jgi:hypothetical protein
MKSMTNHWVLLASLGLGLASSACGGAMDAEEDPSLAGTELVYGKTETISSVPNVLEGDADLYTQNGRNTSYYFSASFLRLDPGNVAVYFVELDLQEEHIPDHTRLQFLGEVSSQLPTTWNIQTINCDFFETSGVIPNKSWSFKTVYQNATPGATTNCFTYLSIKADGGGVDNTGNAQAKVTFSPTITFQ